MDTSNILLKLDLIPDQGIKTIINQLVDKMVDDSASKSEVNGNLVISGISGSAMGTLEQLEEKGLDYLPDSPKAFQKQYVHVRKLFNAARETLTRPE